jgi:hypothetical protein
MLKITTTAESTENIFLPLITTPLVIGYDYRP